MDKEILQRKQLQLEELFENSQNRLFFQSSDLSFASISDMVESEAIDILQMEIIERELLDSDDIEFESE